MDLADVTLSEINQRKTNFTCMWNLKNKTNEQTGQNRNKLTDTENGGCQRGREGSAKVGKGE